MSLFEGLRFRPGNTFIHRLDPRVKLLVSLALLTTAIIYVDVLIVVSLLALEAALVSAAKVGRLWRKTLRGSIQLAVLVFVITFISQYSREPQLLVAAGYSLAYSLRLMVLFILAVSVKVMGLEPVKTIPYLRMFFPS
jgi:energy-coupling factor transporter transmembrane protein EcfT